MNKVSCCVMLCYAMIQFFFSSQYTESCTLVKCDQADLADDSQSVGKSASPCQKTKVCMHTRRQQHIFKMSLLWWPNKGKTRSSKSAASSEEVIVETPLCKQLLMSATSGPLMSAVACTSETSALNFTLFPDGVAVLCVV